MTSEHYHAIGTSGIVNWQLQEQGIADLLSFGSAMDCLKVFLMVKLRKTLASLTSLGRWKVASLGNNNSQECTV